MQVDGKPLNYAIANQGFLLPFNLTGHPVLTIPLELESNQVPVSIQLVGRKYRDYELLEAAAELTQQIPCLPYDQIN